ncbi:hypothetical protein RUM43_005964 [Polyplax serrata]|uniref:Uncharacterized protein n=1 Tax=Polyplax serrata TaxID=468196 RepID=A0AAN8PKD3_POLSC
MDTWREKILLPPPAFVVRNDNVMSVVLQLQRYSLGGSIVAGPIDKFLSLFNLKESIYSIVILAGQDGTLAVLYRFLSTNDGKILKFYSEYREVTTNVIGGPAYDNPEKLEAILDSLLSPIKKKIKPEKRSETKLNVFAVPNNPIWQNPRKEEMLQTCKRFCCKCGLRPARFPVTLVSEKDRRLLSWFTVNLITNRLCKSPKKMVTAVMLGRQTCFVALAVNKKNDIVKGCEEFIDEINLFSRFFKVYSQSYEELGIENFRQKIIQCDPKSTMFISDCIYPGMEVEWKYNNTVYKITGSSGKSQDVTVGDIKTRVSVIEPDNCLKAIQRALKETTPPQYPCSKIVYGLDYFIKILTDAKVIKKTGEKIRLIDIYNRAYTLCGMKDTERPFQCFDLLYVFTLLRDFFGIKENRKIHLRPTVGGMTVNWMFGAAFASLQQNSL